MKIPDLLEKFYTLIQTYPKRALAIVGLFLVILALPLTLAVSQNQQNNVQNAASSGCKAGDESVVNGVIVGCHNGIFDSPSQSKPCPAGYTPTQLGTTKNGTPNYSCLKNPSSTTVASSNPQASENPAASTNPTATNNPTATSNPAASSEPTAAPTPPASPTDAASANSCGTPVPSDFWVKLVAAHGGNNGFLPGEAAKLAQSLGYSQDVIDQAQLRGNPYDNPKVAGTPSDPNPNGGTINFTGCLGVNDDFGTSTNMKAFCYQNGNEVAVKDISGNTDMVALQSSVLGCGPTAQQMYGSGGVASTVHSYRCSSSYINPDGSQRTVSEKFVGMADEFTPKYQIWYECAPNACNISTGKCTKLADGSAPPADYVNDPGLAPNNNPVSSPAPSNKNTTIGLNVGLSGFSSANGSKSTLRDFIIKLLDPSNRVIGTTATSLRYNPSTNTFTGNANLNSLTQNVQGLKVAVDTPGYFQESTQTVIPIAANKTNNVTIPTLQAGDIVGQTNANAANYDKSPNILDYNVFLSCSIFSKDSGAACKDKTGKSLKDAADLNGDGVVNQDDYTILLRSWQLLQNK